MNHYEAWFIALSLAAYGVTAFFYFRHLFGGREFWSRPTLLLLTAGLGLHFLALTAHTVSDPQKALPLANVFETLSFSAWCLVLVFVLVESRWKLTALGALVLPLALVAMAASFLALHRTAQNQPPTSLSQAWLGVHVTLVLVGYAAFTLSFCAAVAYLLQDRFLRSKRFQGLSRQLPPVQVADEAAYRLAALGFPVFTLGLIIGAIWAYSTQPSGWAWDPKVVWSAVTWLVFVVYLHARMASGWKGRKAAALLIIGFLCVIVTYVFTGLLKAGWHHFV